MIETHRRRGREGCRRRLLARRVDGIFLSDFKQGEIGPDLFRHACLKGWCPSVLDSRYRGGRTPDWIKVKNPKSAAMNRARDAFSSLVDWMNRIGLCSRINLRGEHQA